MAPISQTATGFSHQNLNAVLTSLVKRSSSECAYYESSCSTHRLAIIIIIIAVGIIISAILSLLYVRSRRSKAAKLRATMQQQRVKSNDNWQMSTENGTRPTFPYGAPPPYEPRKPERIAIPTENWR